MRNLRLPLASTALVVAASLLLPASVPAATVSVESRVLLFTAAPGEVNDTTISNFVTPLVITDLGAPLVAGPGCRQVTPFECDLWYGQTAYLGDRSDKARLVSFSSSAVYGEGGDDIIASDGEIGWADGGPGADQIGVTGNQGIAHGGPGPDHIQGGGVYASNLYGEEGNDVLTQTRNSHDCHSSLDGGSGSDRLHAPRVRPTDRRTGQRCNHRLPQRRGRRPGRQVRRRTGTRLHRRRPRARQDRRRTRPRLHPSRGRRGARHHRLRHRPRHRPRQPHGHRRRRLRKRHPGRGTRTAHRVRVAQRSQSGLRSGRAFPDPRARSCVGAFSSGRGTAWEGQAQEAPLCLRQLPGQEAQGTPGAAAQPHPRDAGPSTQPGSRRVRLPPLPHPQW